MYIPMKFDILDGLGFGGAGNTNHGRELQPMRQHRALKSLGSHCR